MSERFIPEEIFNSDVQSIIPAKLLFIPHSNVRFYKVELFRLLTGISSFRCVMDDQIINQRNNYLYLPSKYNKNLNPKLGRYIHVDTKILEKKLANHVNRGFYDEILHEFYSYFYEVSKKNQTVAFIHLYRILERISISLPLVYASCCNDYKGVYNGLKKFILDEKTGEIRVLMQFISEFIDDSILNQQVNVEFKELINDWHENHYKAIKKFKLEEASNPYSQLTYKYKSIIELIIKVRNSYFHALTGANNSFLYSEIIHNNEFFKVINSIFCNWLSFVILKIMILEVES